jgi:hypothetical protein
VQPAAFEVDAVRYIAESAETRYVVLCDTNLATIAAAFLGIDYSYGTARGNFGLPEWDWWVQSLYSQMTVNPSVGIFEEALNRGGAGVVYFVVSVREPAYENLVRRISEELFAPEIVLGDGQLTVFKYPSGLAPAGPAVRVTFDDGTFSNESARARYLTQSEVIYTVRLFGHTSYNITDYPAHWVFRDLFVNGIPAQFDASSDVNTFIYATGLATTDVLSVIWKANNLYPKVGFKDDSFKQGWHIRPDYPTTISPNITTDGNVMSISWNFTPGVYEFYYHMKSFSVSTNDYSYIFVRWKSVGPVAYVTISFEPEGELSIVPLGSESSDWTESFLKLSPNRQTAFVTVGITNLSNQSLVGAQSVYIDYFLVCGPD